MNRHMLDTLIHYHWEWPRLLGVCALRRPLRGVPVAAFQTVLKGRSSALGLK